MVARGGWCARCIIFYWCVGVLYRCFWHSIGEVVPPMCIVVLHRCVHRGVQLSPHNKRDKTMTERTKTYNEQLNEQGTISYLTAKHMNHTTGEIVKAFIFIPADKVETVNDAKGWNLPTGTNIKVLIRGGHPCFIAVCDEQGNYTGKVYQPDYTMQTARGRRLHEKIKEGFADLFASYAKGVDIEYETNLASCLPAPDAYASKGASEYTIDDLLGL